MKKWLVTLLATIVLFNFLSVTAQFVEEPFNLSVTDLKLPTGFEELGDEVVFNFQATLNVFNPDSEDVTISHPDTCGFKLGFKNITSEIEGYDYQEYACGNAVTFIEYASGFSTLDLGARILFKDNITELPVGSYYLAPVLPNWSNNQFNQVLGVTIVISEGGIDVIYDEQPPDFSEPAVTPINFQLMLILILSFGLIRRKFNQIR